MFGTYAWNANAAPGEVQQDLVMLICGGAIADCSASCNKALTTVSGVASGFTPVDQPFGVLRHPGQAGGPGMLARITISTGPRVQLAAIDGWNLGTHAATYVTSAYDCSGLLTTAGTMNFLASEAGLLLAASDWATWVFMGEVKRDGPALAGDAAAPGGFVYTSGGYCYLPRLKNPSSLGDMSNASCTLQSAFGTLTSSAARDRADTLYLPLAPATITYSSVPVGEIVGAMLAGGYGQGGDMIVDGQGKQYQLVSQYNTKLALSRV
ncbi:MAG: hypothetical protein FWC58_01215 [Desulfobulbus sp.]|nr:hypothetical protein [Desulfobulbus sp.]